MAGVEVPAEQFDDMAQQRTAASLGMWVFLMTEMMFFGAMFLAYSTYRIFHTEGFAEGSRHMNIMLGTVNTFILLSSSFFMAMAVHAAEEGKNRKVLGFLLVTIVLGSAFVALKFLEYAQHLAEGLNPGPNFAWGGPYAPQVHLFISFYFVMTGTHALHMVVGLCLLSFLAFLAIRKTFTPEYNTPAEVVGLYWHFVDIVWIFLYPLFYLIDIHR